MPFDDTLSRLVIAVLGADAGMDILDTMTIDPAVTGDSEAVSRATVAMALNAVLMHGLLQRVPMEHGAMAMTLGHTILGRTEAALDITREHELVHVRQYERWGPFFIPAYLLFSLVQWLRGKSAYRDNPFEVEAYDEAG